MSHRLGCFHDPGHTLHDIVGREARFDSLDLADDVLDIGIESVKISALQGDPIKSIQGARLGDVVSIFRFYVRASHRPGRKEYLDMKTIAQYEGAISVTSGTDDNAWQGRNLVQEC